MRAATALVFVAATAVFYVALWPLPVLPDNDSYYHLAVARHYAEHGVRAPIPWARFSILNDGLGDKELLFHLLLAPFVALARDASRGGILALALLNALVATVLARSSLLVPFLV